MNGSPQPQPVPEAGPLGPLKRIAEVSAIVGALLYVAGWSYLYSYYRTFGLSVGDLDFPIQVPLIYSFPVMFTWQIIISASSTIALFWLATHGLARTRFVTFSESLISSTSMLIVCVLILGKYLSERGLDMGQREAATNMVLSTTRLYAVNFKIKAPGNKAQQGTQKSVVAPPGTTCAPGSEYRLIAHANKQYFLLIPLDSQKPKTAGGSALSVCVIPEERVESIQLQVPFPKE